MPRPSTNPTSAAARTKQTEKISGLATGDFLCGRPAVGAFPKLAAIAFALRRMARYNDGVLARANPTEEVTEMFCNFDCASLLKMLCSFFGC